jgi:hypothetical protein
MEPYKPMAELTALRPVVAVTRFSVTSVPSVSADPQVTRICGGRSLGVFDDGRCVLGVQVYAVCVATGGGGYFARVEIFASMP